MCAVSPRRGAVRRSPAPRPAEPPQGGRPRPGGRYSRCAGPAGRWCGPLLPPAGRREPGRLWGGGGEASSGPPEGSPRSEG